MNMQAPKGRPSTLEVGKKTSLATPRTARKLKIQGSASELVTSPASKTMKDRSPKVVERRSPRSPVIEKKRPVRVSELEAQVVQLQNDLKKAKDQLGSSDSLKQKAQHEAEEARRHLTAMSKQLEETQKQLENLSDSEQATLQELRKISQDRDRAWQSELEAVQKQNSMDSSALASAMNEIQRLRISSHAEIHNLKMELTETLSLVEELKSQITEIKASEKQTQMELEVVKIDEEQLRTALEDAERRYQEECIQGTVQIRSAYELVERTKADTCKKEAEWEAKFELQLQKITEEREKVIELEKLKTNLLDKETELHDITEENEKLKMELKKQELEEEVLVKLGNLKEEADKSTAETANVIEQLDAAQATNSELEAELRRLKVQADQWRKAAEAAAAMLSTGRDGVGKYVERTGSLDYHTLGGKLGSPFSEDLDDESPKKKNGNMLKKIGTLLKKK